MTAAAAVPWIVTCRSVEDLGQALAGIPGARLLRAIDARRAVVVAPRAARVGLLALPGVEAVEQDTLRHPQGWPAG